MSLYVGYRTTRFTPDPARASVWRAIAGYLQQYVPEEGSLLDLGSGYCDFVNAVKARRRWAVDLHIDPAEFTAEGITPLRADASDLRDVPDGGLDVVFASNLLEHLDDENLERTILEVRRKLRPEGRFIVLGPNYRFCHRTYFDDYTHRKVLTHVSLADLLRAHGFSIERLAPRFLPFSLKGRAPKWSWLVRLYLRSPWKPFAAQMLVIARRTEDLPSA